jgi:hypothetical protein
MHEKETNTGSKPSLGPRICEARAREMDEVLSRCLPSFHRQAHRYVGNAADAHAAKAESGDKFALLHRNVIPPSLSCLMPCIHSLSPQKDSSPRLSLILKVGISSLIDE